MKETDMQNFMVNINDSGWLDESAKDMAHLLSKLEGMLEPNFNEVEVITNSLNLIKFSVIGMKGKFRWERRGIL